MIPTRLNLGCGPDYRENWYNVDQYDHFDPDLVQDLESTPWDLPSDHFEHVLIDNVFEHIDPSARPSFLAECHRVMIPGGLLIMRYPTPGYGVGWDVSHYSIPHWNWPEHPNYCESWEVDDVEFTKISFGRLLPDRVAAFLMWHGIRAVQGIEIHVRSTDVPMEVTW